MEWEIEYTDGRTQQHTVPDKLSFNQGKKLRRKLDLHVEQKNGRLNAELKNPSKLLVDVGEVLFKMFSPTNVSMDDVTMQSVDELTRMYWEQVQGVVKKNVDVE